MTNKEVIYLDQGDSSEGEIELRARPNRALLATFGESGIFFWERRSNVRYLLPWAEMLREQRSIGVRVHYRQHACEDCVRDLLTKFAFMSDPKLCHLSMRKAAAMNTALLMATRIAAQQALLVQRIPPNIEEKDILPLLQKLMKRG